MIAAFLLSTNRAEDWKDPQRINPHLWSSLLATAKQADVHQKTSCAGTGDYPGLREALRVATRDLHDRVDAAYARFDLTDRDDYGAFLSAHARVLPGVEAALDGAAVYPAFKPRSALLGRDLAALNIPMPPLPALTKVQDDAARWGMLYVLEGSRLGGAMLARRIPDDLPAAYLGAVHDRGGWRAFQRALDAAGYAAVTVLDQAWTDRAVEAAKQLFNAFALAAQPQVSGRQCSGTPV